MRALAASCFVIVLVVLAATPARAEGTGRVDLVVREVPTTVAFELRAEESAPVVETRPARPTPLHVRLDAGGRFELLLRVSPDQFLGKLALAL